MVTESKFSATAVDTFHERMEKLVRDGVVPGLVALVSVGDREHVDVIGSLDVSGAIPMPRNALFRIASMTKPVTAVAALSLTEEGAIHIHDAVDRWLPELANRRVLRSLDAELADTVPAMRSITVRDLLTSRMGFGSVMDEPNKYPIQRAEAELGIKTLSMPWPKENITSDEWLRRFASLPLLDQPGEAWRYNTSIEVLGILIERVTGKSLGAVFRERIFEPLGMLDTSFTIPGDALDRVPTSYLRDWESGELRVFDVPETSLWRGPIAREEGSAGLVSTIDDFAKFTRMLRSGGTGNGRQILSEASVSAMTTNQITEAQRRANSLFFSEGAGWGYGMQAPVPGTTDRPRPSGYGWTGGLGTVWYTDPACDLTGILLTQRAMESPQFPVHFTAFWDAAYELGGIPS